MNEYGMEYEGWEIVWDGEPEYLAAGFHSDGMSSPYAVGGSNANSLIAEVEGFDGGWVLWQKATDDIPPEYEVIDGSEYITGYGD